MTFYHVKWILIVIFLLAIITLGLFWAPFVTFKIFVGFTIAIGFLFAIDIFLVDRAIIYFAFPHIRSVMLFLKLWAGRQEFLIGWLAPGYSKNDLLILLREKGFEHDKLAWIDDDEILSERKRYGKGNRFQYHIRLFKDGELRGHKELAPEFAPFRHSLGSYFEPADKYFKKILGDFIIIENRETDESLIDIPASSIKELSQI